MISPGFFKDHFWDTFGPVVHVLEHCGLYFPVFLFVELNIDIVVMIVRHIELHEMTGSPVGFGEIPLRASYNIFFTTIGAMIWNPRAPALAVIEHTGICYYVQNGTHEVEENARKERGAPLTCDEHGGTTIVTCLL